MNFLFALPAKLKLVLDDLALLKIDSGSIDTKLDVTNTALSNIETLVGNNLGLKIFGPGLTDDLWTVPDVSKICVLSISAGGGGGKSTTTAGAGAGGAGSIYAFTYAVTPLTTELKVTTGIGGTGDATGANGVDGGVSTITNNTAATLLLSQTGGGGGNASIVGGVGGTVSAFHASLSDNQYILPIAGGFGELAAGGGPAVPGGGGESHGFDFYLLNKFIVKCPDHVHSGNPAEAGRNGLYYGQGGGGAAANATASGGDGHGGLVLVTW